MRQRAKRMRAPCRCWTPHTIRTELCPSCAGLHARTRMTPSTTVHWRASRRPKSSRARWRTAAAWDTATSCAPTSRGNAATSMVRSRCTRKHSTSPTKSAMRTWPPWHHRTSASSPARAAHSSRRFITTAAASLPTGHSGTRATPRSRRIILGVSTSTRATSMPPSRNSMTR